MPSMSSTLPSPPLAGWLAVPSSFLDKGYSYIITVTLVNFLGSSSQSSVNVVVVVLNMIAPTVSISGPPVLSAVRRA